MNGFAGFPTPSSFYISLFPISSEAIILWCDLSFLPLHPNMCFVNEGASRVRQSVRAFINQLTPGSSTRTTHTESRACLSWGQGFCRPWWPLSHTVLWEAGVYSWCFLLIVNQHLLLHEGVVLSSLKTLGHLCLKNPFPAFQVLLWILHCYSQTHHPVEGT